MIEYSPYSTKGHNMKRIVASLVAAAALLSTAQAKSYPAYGNDSYKALNDSQLQESLPGNFYLGLGYSYMQASIDVHPAFFGNRIDMDATGHNIDLVAGYDFNRWFALEARFTTTVSDIDFDYDSAIYEESASWGGDMSNYGLYFKPKYEVENVGIYALLGYGHVRMDIDNVGDMSSNEWQWGLGISFDAGDSIVDGTRTRFFLDYMRYYDDEAFSQIDYTVDSINVGITFAF